MATFKFKYRSKGSSLARFRIGVTSLLTMLTIQLHYSRSSLFHDRPVQSHLKNEMSTPSRPKSHAS